jgi:hypothetical protein
MSATIESFRVALVWTRDGLNLKVGGCAKLQFSECGLVQVVQLFDLKFRMISPSLAAVVPINASQTRS